MFSYYIHLEEAEEGQSLLEYALIIVLIGVVTVAVVTIFGSTIKRTYCKTVHLISPHADISGPCREPIVMPELVSKGPNHINIEVQVYDPDGNPSNPYAAITQVEFYMDDPSGSPIHTEYYLPILFGR